MSRQGSRSPSGPQVRRRPLGLPADRPGRRNLLVLVVFTVLFALVVGQLVRIQVVQAEEYADRGSAQRSSTIELPARRGRIYDREGAVLATSLDAATIYADPRAFKPTELPGGETAPAAADAQSAARRLAPLLGREPDELVAALTRDRHFVYLARQLDWERGQEIMALEIPGVGLLRESRREYPAGSIGAQLIGFTGIDGDGLHGLELEHDELLRGTPGELQRERAPSGLTIASGVREVLPPVPGTDLVLTIDREVQHVAEEVATGVLEEHAATGASIVVLEVETGDVLAMASAPIFDPDEPADGDRTAWRNRAVTDVFEPGSVQKAVTAAAAIEAGTVTPGTTMRVDDRITVGPKTFSDAHEHEPETMTFAEIIETSSNVGTIMVAQQLGEERLAAALDTFGYGRRLGIDYPGESPGLLPAVDQWWVTSLPTIAIGQGVAVTLLQAASAYGTIANDGVQVTPRLLRGTVGDDGRLSPADPAAETRVVSSETAHQVQDMLARVVGGERGTGARAAVPGYEVAGKTGTARKPNTDARGYGSSYVASFVGFAPAHDPEIVVAVMVDDPSPIWGGVVAAPAFAEVMEYALAQRHVAPDANG